MLYVNAVSINFSFTMTSFGSSLAQIGPQKAQIDIIIKCVLIAA